MPKRILFVDDESDIRAVATFRLTEAGYEVLTAVNGQEALELLKNISVDLILLDIRLPFLDGYEVCKKIKSDDHLKHIPVIIFSASVERLKAGTKECGAVDCLAKPFEPEELLAKVKKVLKETPC